MTIGDGKADEIGMPPQVESTSPDGPTYASPVSKQKKTSKIRIGSAGTICAGVADANSVNRSGD